MPQYMRIDNIKGNVTAQGNAGAVLVKQVQHLSKRGVLQRVGISNREIGIPSIQHLQLVKGEDNASVALWQHFFSGKVLPKVEITRYSLATGKPEWQSKITLNNVSVSLMHHLSHDEAGEEYITLAFSKIERSYRGQSHSGQWQTPKHGSYNLETAQLG